MTGKRRKPEHLPQGSIVPILEALGINESNIRVFDLLGDAIAMIGPDFKVLYQNRIHRRTAGQVAGRFCYEAIHGRDKVCPKCPVMQTFRNGDVRVAERKAAKLGKVFEITSSPLKNQAGKTVAALEIVRDLTVRKLLENETLKNQRLESIGFLAGGIAHDFNNLLTSIIGNIELARMYLNDPEMVRARLIQAEKASGRAKNLARQLLTFSRGGAPIIKIASARDFVRDAVEFSLRGSRIKPRFDLPEDLWLAEMDEGQIRQVIQNLVRNAEEAMPEGGILEVAAENLTIGPERDLPLAEGKYLRISFSDQGEGIPAPNLHKVFDPYFTTKRDGRGLGLAVCHSIIRRHRGHIAVHSEESGTRFTFWLPALARAVRSKPAPGTASHPGQGRVLVLEDSEGVREVLGEMLADLGYEAFFAAEGREAVDRYRQAMQEGEPFAAVILDLTIPGGMGGEQTLRRLRELDPGVKAVATSGYGNDPIMALYREHGFKGIIPKPYRLAELRHCLRQAICGD